MPFDDGLGAGTGEGTQEGVLVPNAAPAVAAGASIYYHSFADPVADSSKYLNDTTDTIISMFAEETANGLQWVLSYVPASAVVYAVPQLTTPTTPPTSMPATTNSATVNGVVVNTVSFDFPTPGPFKDGKYAFYAEVITQTGRVDVTSGIVVQVNPALGT